MKFVVVVAHAPHSWDPKRHNNTFEEGVDEEDAETQSVTFWEHLTLALAKRPLPHCPLFILADANIEASHAQTCYRGIGEHQAAREETSYDSIFAEFVETHQRALPPMFRTFHEGSRPTFAGDFAPRRIDFVGVPNTWLAGVTVSKVLDHFDTQSKPRDHFPVLVSLKGLLNFREITPGSQDLMLNGSARESRQH